jgi:heme exporter protein D
MKGNYGLYILSAVAVANVVMASNAANPVPNGIGALTFALLAIAWRPLP